METRWFIPGGFSISETKVEDRIKELHISSDRLSMMTSQLSRANVAEAALKIEQDKKERMKYISNEMTKNWSDSIQKQQAEKHAHMQELLHKQDDLNLIRYLKVKKDQEEEMKQYVDEMRQKILVRKDFHKTLASAYLFSEVLYEREKQKELKKKIEQHRQDEKREEYEALIADCKKYEIEEQEKKKKLKEKNRALADELLKQKATTNKTRKAERDMRIQEELMDQERARRESDRIKMIRQKKLIASQNYARDALMECIEVQHIEREKMISEDKEAEKVSKIIQNSKERIKGLMKLKAKDKTEAQLAKGLTVFDDSKRLKRDAEIALMEERGFARNAASEKMKSEHRTAKQLRLRQEREEQQKQYLLDCKAKKEQKHDVLYWEMMNRFKNTDEEVARAGNDKKQKSENRDLLVQHYDKDVQLRNDRLKKEDREEDEFRELMAKYKSDDKMYLEHAKEVKALIKRRGWNTYPIDLVILNYQQNTIGEKRPKRCEPTNKLCTNTSHFNEKPGKRTHCPSFDPSIKCKHQKEFLYK